MAFALVFWVALAATAIGVLIIAWRARHGILLTGVALLIVAGVWTLAKVAYDRDWHDADGFFDCYPSCSALQGAVGVGLIGGALLGGVLVFAFCIAVVRRRIRN